MPRRPTCAAVLASLLIAACGGSSHSSSSSSTTAKRSVNPTAPLTAVSSSSTTAAGATTTISAGPTTTAATTSGRPPEVPKSREPRRSHRTAPSEDVRIPAQFVIGAGGAVTPALVSAPKGVTVQLRLRDADSKPHVVVLATAGRPAVHLAAGGSATADVSGLRDGTYRILVDGVTRARLVIGAVPGP